MSTEAKSPATRITLYPIEATPGNFKEYGQIIEPSPDDAKFGPNDAQLDLSQGIPRFDLHPSNASILKFNSFRFRNQLVYEP